ncbi:MAG: serine hydrolase domain-containing protein [Deltaproteobacteria bacterium]
MKALRTLMQGAVEQNIFPGGVLLVASKDKAIFFEAFGRARLSPKRLMTTETVFDLASLTKPLATTLCMMVLVQQGRVALDQTLGHAISEFSDTDKRGITVGQLLGHTSGLPDYRPYYETLRKWPPSERKGEFRKMLLGEALIHEPGKVSLYSDLGFMILEWLIEVASEKPLDRFVQETVYAPLRLKDLFFVPLDGLKDRSHHLYAATEHCPWRGKILEGEVHDDNAYTLGGVAGHAGIFAPAKDIYALLRELLNTYLGESKSGVFHKDLVHTFFQRHSDVGTWALGFDTPTRPDSSSGQYFSDQSVGHLGFTGTSFWMDLEKGVIVILLTNRIHPTRANEKIRTFRPVVYDAVMNAIARRGI